MKKHHRHNNLRVYVIGTFSLALVHLSACLSVRLSVMRCFTPYLYTIDASNRVDHTPILPPKPYEETICGGGGGSHATCVILAG